MANERRQAAESGAIHYSTGRPCSKGHDSLRYTTTGGCIECAKGYSAKFSLAARGKLRRELPPLVLRLHPADHEALYVLADFLNQQRGLPPVARPDKPAPAPVDPRTRWEVIYSFRLRTSGNHEWATAQATQETGPEVHSAGWTWPPTRPTLPPVPYGGAAKPDYL